MVTPSSEQVRWFWEQYGFKRANIKWDYHYELEKRVADWLYPTDPPYTKRELPPIDLNNLFRWAVPKIQAQNEIEIVMPPDGNGRTIVRIGHNSPVDMETTEDAVFWAINKALGGESRYERRDTSSMATP